MLEVDVKRIALNIFRNLFITVSYHTFTYMAPVSNRGKQHKIEKSSKLYREEIITISYNFLYSNLYSFVVLNCKTMIMWPVWTQLDNW